MELPKLVGCVPTQHPYLNNKYTYWYYCIINYAQGRDSSVLGYREKHHIIPESFYLNRIRPGPKGWLQGCPNEVGNIVSLTPREHFLCHWLLTKMVVGAAYIKMERALTYFRSSSKNHERVLSAGQYARIKLACSLKGCSAETRLKIGKSNKGKCRTDKQRFNLVNGMKGRPNPSTNTTWWNNGKDSIRSKENPGNGWVKGQLKQKDTRSWWNDGMINLRSYDCPGPAFKIGRIIHSFWFKEGQCVQSATWPGPGWCRGRGKNNTKWWNNGIKEVQTINAPGAGWETGRIIPKDRLLLWWNNGISHKRSATSPGIGWIQGRLYWRKPQSHR
jgi:hypothetical protein